MDEKKGIAVFFIILLLYILAPEAAKLFTESDTIIMLTKLVVLAIALYHTREWFRFKVKLDFLAITTGVAIALIWVGVDSLYPKIETQVDAFKTIDIILKLIIGVMIAPLIEEFFTRFFLHRIVQSKDWLKEKLGTYDLTAFVVTTLFFGFAHNRWLAGLITGAILNALWYKRKDMNSVVLAHAIANAVLGIIVVYFGLWNFWG